MRKNFLKKAAVVALTTAMAFGMVPAMPATEAKAATNFAVSVTDDMEAGNVTESLTVNGFTFTAGDVVDSKGVSKNYGWTVDENSKVSLDKTLEFTTRIKSNGKSDGKGNREIHFSTTDAADLVIYVLSGSSSDANRKVTVSGSNGEITTFATATNGVADPETGEGTNCIEPNVIALPAADDYVIKVSASVNFYYLAVEYATEGGEEETKLNGLNKDEDGNWFYYTDGDVDTSKTGLVWFSNKWCYVKEGAYCKSRALVWHGSQWWFVNNGTIDKETTGLVWHGNAWYYVSNGTINKDYEGLVWHYNNWYYVKDGKFDNTKNGVVEYKGVEYTVTNGKLYQN